MRNILQCFDNGRRYSENTFQHSAQWRQSSERVKKNEEEQQTKRKVWTEINVTFTVIEMPRPNSKQSMETWGWTLVRVCDGKYELMLWSKHEAEGKGVQIKHSNIVSLLLVFSYEAWRSYHWRYHLNYDRHIFDHSEWSVSTVTLRVLQSGATGRRSEIQSVKYRDKPPLQLAHVCEDGRIQAEGNW